MDRTNWQFGRCHINYITKAVKPQSEQDQGGLVKIDRPIHISNVKKVD